MAFQPSADSFGIRRLGFKCNWWHSRQANYAVASELSIFSENHEYKSFSRVAVNTYVPIFRGLDARGGRKLRTDTHTHIHTHTHTHRTTTVTLTALMHTATVNKHCTQSQCDDIKYGLIHNMQCRPT